MKCDDIRIGDPVTVTSRHNMPALLVDKFKSRQVGPGAPAGTEYVRVQTTDGQQYVNHPHQLEPR